MTSGNVLVIDQADNVGVALTDLPVGEELLVQGKKITVEEEIARGHKVALETIKKGEPVIKYGFPIGSAVKIIKTGELVHTHNLETNLEGKLEYNYHPSARPEETPVKDVPTFKGYLRKNGQVGIRNEIWLVPTVGCVNKPMERIARLAEEKYQMQIEEGIIDGFFAFPHPYGCSQLGGDLKNTQKALAGLVKHPNAAGVLVLGLGCENNYLDVFKDVLGDYDPSRVKFINLQEVENGIEKGLAKIDQLFNYAAGFKQTDIPLSELKIGLKCGGSDAFSGITANPLLGRISDRLTSYGGTAILTEVPEMFGAETILMDRAADEATFNNIVTLINDFKEYFISHNQPIYENPAPGNKKGGISTLEEKSLGCTHKGGTSIVKGVNFYGEQVIGKGLQLVESPGNDLVSTTALTISGAHLILFTTGRGTPFGTPVPTVKVATNTPLYQRKPDWIDFNAGSLLEGEEMDKLADRFFDYIVRVASKDKKTNNEKNGYREIAIFKNGVTV